jgi:hypothetical protein
MNTFIGAGANGATGITNEKWSRPSSLQLNIDNALDRESRERRKKTQKAQRADPFGAPYAFYG